MRHYDLIESLGHISSLDAAPVGTREKINAAYAERLAWSFEKPRGYICSPLSAPNPEGVQHNMELAKYYLMQMKRLYHCRTFASHAHLPLMLDDRIPEERETAMQIGALMLDLCEVLIICGSHISEGMRSEIQTAFVKGKDIYWYDSKMKPGELMKVENWRDIDDEVQIYT